MSADLVFKACEARLVQWLLHARSAHHKGSDK